MERRILRFPRGELEFTGVPRLMGILNVTPDSFYDGGRFLDRSQAEEQAFRLAEEGADILDLGGESTRPGSDPVPLEEEIRRVVPLISRLAERIPIPISIDTSKARVAREAVAAGAGMVNDISGLAFDPEMARVVAEARVPVVLMHTRGRPKVMQENPVYADLIGEIRESLRAAVGKAEAAGIDPGSIIIDPGIGFGKTVEHNLAVLKHLGEFRALGRLLLVGISRKSFIGKVLDEPVGERLAGSLGAAAIAVWNGADLIRAHDVGETRKAIRMAAAIKNAAVDK